MGHLVEKNSLGASIIAEEERLYGQVQARVALGEEDEGRPQIGASDLDASDFSPHSLTASTPKAAATAGTVALTGVIKDKRTGRVIAGVKVNVTGVPTATSNSKGYRSTGKRGHESELQGGLTVPPI